MDKEKIVELREILVNLTFDYTAADLCDSVARAVRAIDYYNPSDKYFLETIADLGCPERFFSKEEIPCIKGTCQEHWAQILEIDLPKN